MTNLDFPNNPAVDDPFPSDAPRWRWDGEKWVPSVGAEFLPLSGGTLTGPLTLHDFATSDLEAVPYQQLESVVSNYLPLTGGTLTGGLIVSTGSVTVSNDNISARNLQLTGDGNISSSNGTITLLNNVLLSGNILNNLNVGGSASVANDLTVGGTRVARITASTTAPANPRECDLWLDKISSNLFIWTGAQWIIAVNPPSLIA